LEKGFTLVELLIVISILLIAFTLGIPNLIKGQQSAELKSGKTEVLSIIELARYKALANEVIAGCTTPSGYTLTVESSELVLSGNCAGSLTEIKKFSLAKFRNLQLSASLALPFDFTFQKLTGIVGSQITLCVKHQALNKFSRINIFYSGKITHEDNQLVCP
jgi:prepilin-type N-terminal cleavage/methylation domain-containing protein